MELDGGGLRLIPAGAGRTLRFDSALVLGWAHPRWRGEDSNGRVGGLARRGSSPLARGGRQAHVAGRVDGRLIPAGAGRTACTRSSRVGMRAHPRWRGEDCTPCVLDHAWLGSSPLARGGRRTELRGPPRLRLIPAGAGRTQCRRSDRSPPAAHPRWRGEDSMTRAPTSIGDGSSPLARGGPTRCSWTPHGVRLIPAGAGRTPSARAGWFRITAHPRWRGEDSLPRLPSET